MAAAKRKSATPDSKPPTKRARKSTSPAKVKEEDPDSDGRGEELRKPIKEDREQETSILPDLMSETPLAKLYQAMKELSEVKVKDSKPSKDGIVVYWMRRVALSWSASLESMTLIEITFHRNKDLRITDNTALSHASAFAQTHDLPLVVLHIFSPSDYKAHDRSPRRIDFQLRQLKHLQEEFEKHDIPLYTFSHDKRKEIPSVVCKKLEEWGAVGLYANVEYEVDELRRDTEIIRSVKDARKSGKGYAGKAEFLKDLCVVPPGEVTTKVSILPTFLVSFEIDSHSPASSRTSTLLQQGKPYAVFSPFFRNWAEQVNGDLLSHIGENNDDVKSNPSSAREHSVLKDFFGHQIPDEIKGFELSKEDHETMEKLWPIGDAVDSVLKRFLKTKIREQTFFEAPLYEGAEDAKDPKKDSKIGEYCSGRNRVDLDGTSHLS